MYVRPADFFVNSENDQKFFFTYCIYSNYDVRSIVVARGEGSTVQYNTVIINNN